MAEPGTGALWPWPVIGGFIALCIALMLFVVSFFAALAVNWHWPGRMLVAFIALCAVLATCAGR